MPVDAYGVGSSLIRGDNDFTADIVLLDGRPCAKVGRRYAAESHAWSRSSKSFRIRRLRSDHSLRPWSAPPSSAIRTSTRASRLAAGHLHGHAGLSPCSGCIAKLMPRTAARWRSRPRLVAHVAWTEVAGPTRPRRSSGGGRLPARPEALRALGAQVPKGILFTARPGPARRSPQRRSRTSRAPASTPRAPRRSSRCSPASARRASASSSTRRARTPRRSSSSTSSTPSAGAQRPRVQPRAGPDAEPAARRARRLRFARPGRRHGRLEPPPGSRPGAPAARPLRPPDPHLSRPT